MASTPTATRRFTRADLDRFPDDGNRYELLDGLVLVTPAPRTLHQHVVVRLLRCFEQAGAYALPAPVDVVLAEDTVLQPDVCVWHEPLDHEAPGAVPVPDVVVEVASPTTRRRDLSMKRDRYAVEGIAEYWFVDVDRRRVLVHHLVDGAYAVVDEDPATSRQLDLAVTVAELLD